MKNTLRFFVPPEVLRGREVHLRDAALAHQVSRVLRLRPGDHVLFLDGQGTVCEAELTTVTRDEMRARILSRAPAAGEPSLTLVVYLALIRPERFEWALQKCVELGAQRLVPVHFARSLPADQADSRKLERWRRIVREAAEQACRGLLPLLDEPLPFAAACEQAATADLALILWEGEAPHLNEILRVPPHQTPASCALLTGPEGGITLEELTAARAHGIMPASLGPRILRAETAPVAALAALTYEFP